MIALQSSALFVQNDSEQKMHRRLYILRFLRAGILRCILYTTLIFMNMYFNVVGIYSPVDEYVEFD